MSSVCPDCKGTKVYKGLEIVEPCRTCQSKQTVIPNVVADKPIAVATTHSIGTTEYIYRDGGTQYVQVTGHYKPHVVEAIKPEVWRAPNAWNRSKDTERIWRLRDCLAEIYHIAKSVNISGGILSDIMNLVDNAIVTDNKLSDNG